MSNTKKALKSLAEKVETLTNAEADNILSNILESYELLVNYRANSKKEAFINSIYALSKEDKFQDEIRKKDLQVKINKSSKFRILMRYEEDIKAKRIMEISYNNIAQHLNGTKVHEKGLFNAKSIERFCKERNIIKGAKKNGYV